jgi:hypothetical protein
MRECIRQLIGTYLSAVVTGVDLETFFGLANAAGLGDSFHVGGGVVVDEIRRARTGWPGPMQVAVGSRRSRFN